MFPSDTKILVVDDMLTMRKIISRACTRLGLENITQVSDGAVAWDELSKEDCDIGLVISDWNMPNCTGIDLLHRIRKNNKLSSLPFIMVTAEKERDQISAAVETGVDAFLPKPFTQEDFEAKIRETYERRFGDKKY